MDSKSQKTTTKCKQEKEENNIDKDKTKNNNEESNAQIENSISYLENNKSLDEFNENNYQNRKYNSENLENGKLFFKLRYLKKKINEIKNKNSSNIKKDNKKLVELNRIEKEKLLRYENLFLNYDKTKENNMQKYSYYFLILIEKSIIFFNLKQFKESFDILKNYDIIKNAFEFGEILLTISGYDKMLIGELLSNNIEPNENSEVLKGFINSFEMNKNENIIELFKYINTKVILPSDKGKIVNEISLCYYESHNKNIDIFIDKYKNESQSVGIFLNLILTTINTFSKNEENKLENQISMIIKDFIKKEEIPKFSDNIKTILNITIDNDYIDELYTRFTVLLEEKENIFNNKNINELNDIPHIKYYEYLQEKELSKEYNKTNDVIFKNYIITHYDKFTQKDQQILTTPIVFHRVNGTNIANLKEYIVVDGFKKIAYEKNINDVNELKHFILIDDINDIYLGNGHGENFKKYLKAFPKEEDNQNNYMSILCNKEQIDLKSTNIIDGLKWYKSLKALFFENKIKNKNNNKNENNKIENNKIKEDITFIWKNYILEKWEIYGNYFLFKCLDHSNYLPDLYIDGKPQTSSIKIDCFEDKKIPLSKAINTFLKEVKDKLSKKDDRILEYNEFFNLCQIGLPNNYRKKIWPLLIGNKCAITFTFYESLKNSITQINNFKDIESTYKSNFNSNFSENYIVNEIIKDIIKIKYLFLDEDLAFKKEPNNIMTKVYSICICFYLYRFDISYNKNLIYIIYSLLLKNISEENVFILINNLIFSNDSLTKLYLWEERDIKTLQMFFEEIFSEYLPKLKKHFDKLGITCDLYLYDWIEGLFMQSLNINISSIIFELFLIYGEYILIQTSITILKILEKELFNLTINEIFKKLKDIPLKISLIKFFEIFRNYSTIKEKFRNNKYANEYAIQSSMLLEALL